jgi:hypothetical protein
MTDTVDALQSRLVTAQRRGREARALEARLLRKMRKASKRREAQTLCILGRALIAMAARSPRFNDQARVFLADYITREGDRAALVGSPFELNVGMPAAAKTSPAGSSL